MKDKKHEFTINIDGHITENGELRNTKPYVAPKLLELLKEKNPNELILVDADWDTDDSKQLIKNFYKEETGLKKIELEERKGFQDTDTIKTYFTYLPLWFLISLAKMLELYPNNIITYVSYKEKTKKELEEILTSMISS